MEYFEYFHYAVMVLAPLLVPFFDVVPGVFNDFAVPVVFNCFISAVIDHFTIGPAPEEKSETSLEYLAAALANASNITDNALVPVFAPRSDLVHPLVEALNDLMPKGAPTGAVDFFAATKYHVTLLVFAICVLLYVIVRWPSKTPTSSPWEDLECDLDWESKLAPLAGLSAMVQKDSPKSVPSQENSETSWRTRLASVFKRSSTTQPTSQGQVEPCSPELSPMMFSDRAAFSSDDPDAIHAVSGSTSPDSSQAPGQAKAHLVPDTMDTEVYGCPITPPPSLDALASLVHSTSGLKSQPSETPLQEPLTKALESASLQSPALSSGVADIYEDVPVMPDNYMEKPYSEAGDRELRSAQPIVALLDNRTPTQGLSVFLDPAPAPELEQALLQEDPPASVDAVENATASDEPEKVVLQEEFPASINVVELATFSDDTEGSQGAEELQLDTYPLEETTTTVVPVLSHEQAFLQAVSLVSMDGVKITTTSEEPKTPEGVEESQPDARSVEEIIIASDDPKVPEAAEESQSDTCLPVETTDANDGPTTSEDAEDSQLDIYPLEECERYFEGLSEVPQASADRVSDLIGETVTVKDLLAIKLWYGMQDDETNTSGRTQTTLVHDCRLSTYFPGHPSTLSTEAPSSASDEPPPPSGTITRFDSDSPRRRTRTEPPIGMPRGTTFSDAVSSPARSLGFSERHIWQHQWNSIMPSTLLKRYPRMDSKFWEQLHALSSRLSLTLPDSSFIRSIPRAEDQYLLDEEARALKLATEVLGHKLPFAMPASSNSSSDKQAAEGLVSPTIVEAVDDVLPTVASDNTSVQEEAPHARTHTQFDFAPPSPPLRLDGDNRVPRWIAAPDTHSRQRPRTRTTTFQSNAADFETDHLPSPHKRAISACTLLQESGLRSKKAKMSSLKEMARHKLLSGPPSYPPVTPTKAEGSAPSSTMPTASAPFSFAPATSALASSTPKASEPPATTVAPRPPVRRRSSRPSTPSAMGTPKLATIIGSPTASPPTTTFAHASDSDVAQLSLDELATAVFGGKVVGEVAKD